VADAVADRRRSVAQLLEEPADIIGDVAELA